MDLSSEHAHFMHCLRLIGSNRAGGRNGVAQTLLETLSEEFEHHVALFEQKVLPPLRSSDSYAKLAETIRRLHADIERDLLAARVGAEVDFAGLEALFQEHAKVETEELRPLLSRLWSLNRQGLDDLPRLEL